MWDFVEARQNRTHSTIVTGATEFEPAAFNLNPDSRNLSSKLSLPPSCQLRQPEPLVEARVPTNHDAIASIRKCSLQ